MATTFFPRSSLPPTRNREDVWPNKRRKEDRKDIWTSLLRQTREAQARNQSSHALAYGSLVVCGGSPDDQRSFFQSIARPPPVSQGKSRADEAKAKKAKGEVRLSNRYAYGYGHVTLFSAGSGLGAGGIGAFGQEPEEAARVELHCIPEAHAHYEASLRRILTPKRTKIGDDEAELDEMTGLPVKTDKGEQVGSGKGTELRPSVVLLLSWKEPWKFMDELRAWLQLLAGALIPANAKIEDPIEVLREFKLKLNVVVQHTDAQISLERDAWKEERFDYVSQMLRTAILPLDAALVYTSFTTPPQQPNSPLTDVQKVIFATLGFDLAALSPSPSRAAGSTPTKREDLLPKHNVVDRMAVCVPAGWDSVGKIRLLSENFSPEDVLASWQDDLEVPSASLELPQHSQKDESGDSDSDEARTDSGAEKASTRQQEELFGTGSDNGHQDESSSLRATSPSKPRSSAVASYRAQIEDPNAHKLGPPSSITSHYKPEQEFMAEMKSHLDALEQRDADKPKPITTGKGRFGITVSNTGAGRLIGFPEGDSTGALNALGDVSFNVGGVNYNTTSAEAAIASIRRTNQQASPSSPHESAQLSGLMSTPNASTPRAVTPRPPGGGQKRDDRHSSTPGSGTPSGRKDEVPVEELEKYFASLMKKGTGGSQANTPSRG